MGYNRLFAHSQAQQSQKKKFTQEMNGNRQEHMPSVDKYTSLSQSLELFRAGPCSHYSVNLTQSSADGVWSRGLLTRQFKFNEVWNQSRSKAVCVLWNILSPRGLLKEQQASLTWRIRQTSYSCCAIHVLEM